MGKSNEITVQTLLKNIEKDQFSPVYLVVGEDKYYLEKIKQAFLDKIPAAEREFNVGKYDLENIPLATALDDAQSVPFFGEYRIVFLQNPVFLTGAKAKNKVEHDVKYLENYLKNPQPTTLLVILANYKKLDGRKKIVKDLKRLALVVQNQPLNEYGLKKLIQSELKQKGFTIEPAALELLLERTNLEMQLTMNEVAKLQLSVENQVIDYQTVAGLVPKSVEQNVFDLVDFVLKKDIAHSLERYRDILSNKTGSKDENNPIQINALLMSQFRLMLQIQILSKIGYAQGEITKALKANPKRIEIVMRQAQKFQREDLKKAYYGLFEVDKKLKTTSLDPSYIFQLFLLDYITLK
ncbi:DNA polymerase III subunit delta [Ligilactobacillus ceti]|uniref:DNA polymerase III subunit delta n=1 Tax=Ligilactobacillus ceti DSM 22408 TaxID=1122146 RepID=A0A0R2KRK3_9LACO|nr:DNA polymerase III subunit delta [Ligilactobacillus ceti]KRN88919.1 DNA polymerase III subunit delta [Ligilactobacillus ceti DSM 22408]